MAVSNEIIVLEHSEVFPPPGSVTNKTIPLCPFQDIMCFLFPPTYILFFYESPHPKSHFINTIIPNLKNSLSITLKHFYPMAGNIIVFPFSDSKTTPRIPEIRYLEGDSVSFTTTECTKDFDYLTGNHYRKANEFYPLLPKLGDVTKEDSGNTKVPIITIQVTLFPNKGICIGITNHHSSCDGNAITNFLKAWTWIAKYGDDKKFIESGLLPFFDRSIIKDTANFGENLWREIAETRIQESQPKHASGNNEKLRATFIMTRDQINKLKKYVLAQRPTISRLSSFTIVCAHFWICFAKLNKLVGEEDEREQFTFGADCRTRLDPPIPTTFFGNCLTHCKVMSNRDELVGEEGYIKGVELMGEAIVKMFKSQDSIYEGKNKSLKSLRSTPATAIMVAGSPKFDKYGTDFGWGKPKKCELVSIDFGRVISLSTSSSSAEDIEIGMTLSIEKLNVFESIFIKELSKY